jgi:hypothetical protein
MGKNSGLSENRGCSPNNAIERPVWGLLYTSDGLLWSQLLESNALPVKGSSMSRD